MFCPYIQKSVYDRGQFTRRLITMNITRMAKEFRMCKTCCCRNGIECCSKTVRYVLVLLYTLILYTVVNYSKIGVCSISPFVEAFALFYSRSTCVIQN